MAVPTTNVKFDDIWFEANNTNLVTTNDIPATSLFGKSYFDGPNGSSTISYNGWGSQTSDLILGITSSAYNWGQFRGLSYWYDNTTWDVRYRVNNNLPIPTPPARPDENDCNVFINLTDNTEVYQYLTSNSITANANTSVGYVTFSVSGYGGTPLIYNVYYNIVIQTSPSWVSGQFDLTINSVGFATSVPIYNGTNNYSYSGLGGNSTIDANSVSGVAFEITIY